ncbi:MAG: restriction endonuclease subunit S [Hydrogenophaga sp.]|nr:restriction endonuclease subunit S [Hydrogenophaga sp.]MDO9479281.1 restriction endonuclease subunit S [Hydrogenophaga sp.]MDP3346643.1 restriction endonuclease subunit S [Hydrogenophaga sp.]MDP3807631.1 restriction endonuclease subunit S [Hydrogenophaga sp.]MDP3925774.1 restriction endonuclease subunit S [Hydrogenophaga sp.]MDZ4237494.1 restriction endonuclease subunit S [Hydrogenophaga sp.]
MDGDWVESKDQDPDGDVRLIQLADVGDGYYVDKSNRFLTSSAARRLKCTFIEPGDVLIARMPDPLGRACIFPGDSKRAVTVVDVCVIRVDPSRMLGRWLMHCINSPTCRQQIDEYTTGTTRQRISRGNLGKIHIPLPPLPEQRRIAAILDQADTLRTQRRAALAQLDSLTQSLFLDMFGDPVTNERGWPRARIDSFVAGFESGKSLVADDEDDASSTFRVLKVSAVTSLEYKPEQSKAVPSDYKPPISHIVRAGDLLFSRANTTELIGATAFVEQTPDNLLLPDKLWRFVWHKPPRTTPLYVRHLFRQPKFRHEIGQRASGTSGSMKNISQDKVLSIEVGHPPLPLQQTFATRIQAIEALKTQHRAALAAQDALFASLQQRAFAGTL